MLPHLLVVGRGQGLSLAKREAETKGGKKMERKWKTVILGIALLNILDIITTAIGIQMGATEMNPWFPNPLAPTAILYKVVIATVFCGSWAWLLKVVEGYTEDQDEITRKFAKIGSVMIKGSLAATFAVYTGVILNNVVGLVFGMNLWSLVV